MIFAGARATTVPGRHGSTGAVAASRAKSVTDSCSPRVVGSIPAAAEPGLGRGRAARPAGEGGAQALAPGGEGGVDDGEGGPPVAGRGRPADQRDQPGVDVRLGPEDPPADGAGPAHLAVPGGLDRGDAVGVGAGAGRQPLGDLGLDQDQRPVEGREELEQGQQHRHGDVVRQVGDQRRRRRAGQLGQPERVGLHDREPVGEVRGAGGHRHRQLGGQARIDLDGDHARGGRQQPEGQRAEAGPDLEDDVVRAQLRGAHDPPDRVGVVQEVLAEALRRPQLELLGQLADRGRAQQPVGLVGRSAQREGSAEQAGPAVRPLPGAGACCRAICARAVCSSAEAAAGSPVPPTDAHVRGENWYMPR